jgi:vitamin B12 transporter
LRFAALRVATFAIGAVVFPLSGKALSAPAPSPSPTATATGNATGNLRVIGTVSTSDRRDEPISQSSRPTYVIDRAYIDAYGARTVNDALQSVPGLELYNYGGFGALVNYGARGSTSEQTLVLVDGQPVTSADTGGVYLQQLSTIGVDRIEVVESGSSTLYGTSASGGVINIITAVPRKEYFEISDGSFADRDVQVAAGDGIVGVAYERHVVDNNYGYPAITYNSQIAYPAGTRENAYADQSSLRALLNAPLGAGFTIRARADDTTLSEGVPGGLSFLTPADTQGLGDETGDVSISHAGKNSTISLDLSGARQQLAFFDPSSLEDDTYTGRAQASLKDTSTFGRADLVAGVDLSRESGVFSFPTTPIYNSTFTSIVGYAPPSATGAAQSQAAAYAQAGYDVATPLRVIAGLRAEHDAPQGSVLAPSFGGVLKSGSLRLSGNIGESFRVPTLEDLYYPGFSNPNLLPEKAATSDATLAYDGANESLSIGYFSRSGSNFIVDNPLTFVPFNASIATTSGLQFTARSRSYNGVVFDASFTDEYTAIDRSTGARLPEVPIGSAIFGITKIAHGAERLAYGLRWRIVGSDGDDQGSVPNTETVNGLSALPAVNNYNANDSIDAFLRYKLAPSAILSLRGFNLADEHNAPIYGYPAPGRRLYVELATQ